GGDVAFSLQLPQPARLGLVARLGVRLLVGCILDERVRGVVEGGAAVGLGHGSLRVETCGRMRHWRRREATRQAASWAAWCRPPPKGRLARRDRWAAWWVAAWLAAAPSSGAACVARGSASSAARAA